MKHRVIISLLRAIVLAAWTLIVLIPILIVILNSFKTMQELRFGALRLPESFQFSNYATSFREAGMLGAFGNSFLITLFSVVCIVVCASMAAYPISRSNSGWFRMAFFYFLSGLMVPFQLAMVPLYKVLISLKLIGTHAGVVLVYCASAMGFAVFLYTGFLKTVPRELEEAALIDGAGKFRTFWMVVFPLVKPISASVAITNSLFVWNDFFIPLLFLQSKAAYTIPLTIYSFRNDNMTAWPLLFAAVAIASLPLVMLFIAMQKHFIRGLASGAVKG
mgnify:CR=1 FL=1